MVTATLLIVLLAARPAAPAIVLAPAAARPGDAVLVRVVRAPGRSAPSGSLAGRPLSFWRAGAEWRALSALPLETPVGEVAAVAVAGRAELRATLRIVEPGFPSRALTLPAQFVEPPPEVKARIAEDRAAFDAVYARPLSPPRFGTRFALPRRAPISGRFGDRRLVNGAKETVHYGLDLKGARGAPVHAAADGEVALTRDAYMSGRTVVLSHGAGVFTLYFHLDRIDVRPGQRVRRGQRVGRVGATGRASGPHLHWSVRVDGLLVDPASLMAIDFARGTAPPRVPRPPPPAPAPAAPEPTAAPGTPAAPEAPMTPSGEPAPTSSPPSSPPTSPPGGAPPPSP